MSSKLVYGMTNVALVYRVKYPLVLHKKKEKKIYIFNMLIELWIFTDKENAYLRIEIRTLMFNRVKPEGLLAYIKVS